MKSIKSIVGMFGDLFRLYLPASKNNRNEAAFVFLVHPRDTSDFYRKYPFLKIFPAGFVEFIMQFIWPVTLSEITGLVSKQDGKPVQGWLISILFTGKMLLKKRISANKKILQAMKLAEKKGARIIGLGALTSSITKGGLELVGKTSLAITNGNSLTAAITLKDVSEIIKDHSKKISSIAIVGATGSIGQAVSLSLANKNAENLIIIGKTPKHLEELEKKMRLANENTKIIASTELSKISEADIIIVATASPDALIKAEHLKNGAIIYDVSQPQNVDRGIIKSRPDIRLIDGGTVSTPRINYHFNFGLPRETAFACLTETMLLAAEKIFEDYSVGPIEVKKIQGIERLAEKYNFKKYSSSDGN
jgi:predicted amino acid dehydrogenase